jgi:hypothetical protein
MPQFSRVCGDSQGFSPLGFCGFMQVDSNEVDSFIKGSE